MASSSTGATSNASPFPGEEASGNESVLSNSFLGLFYGQVTDYSGNKKDSIIVVSGDLYIREVTNQKESPSTLNEIVASKTALRVPLDRLPDSATQEEVLQVVSQVPHNKELCLRLHIKRKKPMRPRGQHVSKANRSLAYYFIKLYKEDEQKQLFSYLKLALLPLRLLQDAWEKLIKELPSSAGARSTNNVFWHSMSCDEDRRNFVDTANKIATEGANVITQVANLAKTSTKFAVGTEKATELFDMFTGFELIGPICLAISLTTRLAGNVLRLKANRSLLPDLHKKLMSHAQTCKSILYETIKCGRVQDNKALLCDMLSAVTECWSTSQEAERLLLCSSTDLFRKDKEVQGVVASLNKIEDKLAALRILQYSQSGMAELEKRGTEQGEEIEGLKDEIQNMRARCVANENKFERSWLSVPTAENVAMFVEGALPRYGDLKKAVLGNHIVELTGQSTPVSPEKAFVEGQSGIGKSTACIAICRNEEIIERFPDGIHYMEFSLEADDTEVVKYLTRAMKHAGYRKMAEEAEEHYKNEAGPRDAVEDVVQDVRRCFKDKKVLFVIDNVSFRKTANGHSKMEWPDLLCGIVGAAPRSQILFSSRYPNLARRCFRQVPFGVLRMDNELEKQAAQRLIEEYAKDPSNPQHLSEADKRARDELVKICDGLQLCLCIAGRMVANNKGQWVDLVNVLRKSRLISERVRHGRGHLGLEAVMKVCLEMLDSENLELESQQNLTCAEVRARSGRKFKCMYASFCVLRSAQSVSCCLWKPLFGVETDQEAKAVAQFLEKLGLAQIGLAQSDEQQNSSEVLILHDMQHEFARMLSKDKGAAWYHRRFVKQCAVFCFGKNAVIERVEWSQVFKDTSEFGKYLAQNLVYHLLNGAYSCTNPKFESSYQEEASKFYEMSISTLVDFKWIRGRALSGGRAAIISDYRSLLSDEAVDTVMKWSEAHCSRYSSETREATTGKESLEKGIVRGGEVAALYAICSALSSMYSESFLRCERACRIHKEEGAKLGGELIGRLELIDFEGGDNLMVDKAKRVLKDLKESVKSSVKGPLLFPVRGIYESKFAKFKDGAVTLKPNLQYTGFSFVRTGKLLAVFCGWDKSLILFNSNKNYHEVGRYEKNCSKSLSCSCCDECSKFANDHFILVERQTRSLCLHSFSDWRHRPTQQHKKELLLEDGCEDFESHVFWSDYSDASKSAEIIAAVIKDKVWVWKKVVSSHCAMDPECAYKMSAVWSEPGTKDLLSVKVTLDGKRVLCMAGSHRYGGEILASVTFIFDVVCDEDGMPALNLRYTKDLSGYNSWSCGAVLSRDCCTAYIAIAGGCKKLDLATGSMLPVIAPDLEEAESDTDSFSKIIKDLVKALDLWEDDREGVSPVLTLIRKGQLECWSIQASEPAQLERKIALHNLGTVSFDCVSFEKWDLCVRKRPSTDGGSNDALEIAVGYEGVIRVFSVRVDEHRARALSNAVDGSAIDENVVSVISRNKLLNWKHAASTREINRPSGKFVLGAGDNKFVLLDSCTGDIVDEKRLDDDEVSFEGDQTPHERKTTCLAIDASPSGDCVLVGTVYGTLYQWKVEEDASGRPALILIQKQQLINNCVIGNLMYCHEGLAVALCWGYGVVVWENGTKVLEKGIGTACTKCIAYFDSHRTDSRIAFTADRRCKIARDVPDDLCSKPIAYFKSRQNDGEFIAYRMCNGKCFLLNLHTKHHEEISEHQFSSRHNTLSAKIEAERVDLQAVREVEQTGDEETVYSRGQPLVETVRKVQKNLIAFPSLMAQCGCTPVTTTDLLDVAFLYSTSSVQDAVRPFQIIAGTNFGVEGVSGIPILHLYMQENN